MRACALVCCILVQGCIASQPVSVDDETFMLQLQSKAHERHTRSGHYWPQPRGGLDHYSRTSYGVPRNILENGNLSDYLAWTWTHADYLDTSVKGTLIDKDKNIYIIAAEGIFKYTPDGELLWQRDDILGTQMGSISGSSLYAWDTYLMMYALDLDTGSSFWSRKVGENRGLVADMVTVNNGVVLAGVDQPDELPEGWRVEAGVWSKRVVGINASNGDELWSYQPDAGLWNIMGVFPDDDTVIFMDSGGGLYRLGLHNGSQLWKRAPDPETFTDGGATLGPDGSVYTCSDEPYSLTKMAQEGTMSGIRGRVRKFKQSTGEKLWEREIARACLNFPAVSADGNTLVLGDGYHVLAPPTRLQTQYMNRTTIDRFYKLHQELLRNKSQLTFLGLENVNASIMGFDTKTGEMKWQHEVEPWHGASFAGDEERAYKYVTNQSRSPHCGPPHWGGATIDDARNVYIGRSDGTLHIFNMDDKSEVTFKTNDGMMMAGVSFAPGLMVVPTCSSVYVFKF
mmetsp:Transcript_14459/g.25558  ORF Transcript_14459/g.25558 Transcript_14459/m.25558 type:complete len:511 (-) Transcript_14459:222-1754(-)